MARTKKLPYREGTWFAVPLRSEGYALGVVARLDGGGTIFGYFFGPQHESVPTQEVTKNLRPDDAVYSCQFGDLGLIEKSWFIIGESAEWCREAWPLPPFIRADIDDGIAWKVVYSDDNLELVSEERCDLALAEIYPKDSLAGSGFVELRLTRKL